MRQIPAPMPATGPSPSAPSDQPGPPWAPVRPAPTSSAARWLARLRPPPERAADRVPRDLPLEALRGLCALAVLSAHAFAPRAILDPRYAPSRRFWWFDLGGAAVLMFFVMSGYVIGLTVRHPCSGLEVRRYLFRRLRRLLPVTYAAILLSWLLAPGISGHTLGGHFLFLQNAEPYPVTGWRFDLLPNNPSLWTLNFEAFYYVGFLAIWWLAPPTALAASLLGALCLGPVVGLAVPTLVARQACGGLYWLAGLSLAWFTPPNTRAERSHWPSALLCAYALWNFGSLRALLLEYHVDRLLWLTVASPHRLDFLPACGWCLLAVTGRAPALRRVLAAGCLGWAWFGLLHTALRGDWLDPDWPAAGALVVATALIGWRPSLESLGRLAPLGAVSFGVYAFGLPLQLAFPGLLPEFSGSGVTFGLRLCALLASTFALAWLVDYRLNRWLAARTRRWG